MFSTDSREWRRVNKHNACWVFWKWEELAQIERKVASSLTALLHPGHKASQRYLWSQLGHGGRRRSDRH